MTDGLGPVLIGFGDSAAVAGVARGLIDAGHRVVSFQRAGRRGSRLHPPDLPSLRITAPEDDGARAIDDLINAAAVIRPAAVLPLDDAAVWLVGAAAPDLEAPVAGPTGALVGLALDRRVQLTGAELAGLPVPETVTCNIRADLLALPDVPLAMRPALVVHEHAGRLVRTPTRRCRSRAQLEQLAERWDERLPLLAQALVDGRAERVAGIVTRTGFEHWTVDRRPLELEAPGYAWAQDEDALDRCEALLGEAHWRGPFCVDFIRDADDRLWFLGLAGGCTSSDAASEHPSAAVADALGLAAPTS